VSLLVHRFLGMPAALAVLVLASGCATTKPPGPYSPMTEAGRDPAASQRLTQEAVALMVSEPTRAESLLREALNSDLYNGPAHNNLGALYLAQGKLYEAAGEFEWARKLMPGHPDVTGRRESRDERRGWEQGVMNASLSSRWAAGRRSLRPIQGRSARRCPRGRAR
jgi:tetratricopeptide (TPR) repeat protein